MGSAKFILSIGLALSIQTIVQGQQSETGLFTTKGKQTAPSFIDKPLLRQYSEFGIRPAPTCSDSVFIRRTFLDLTGSIPTGEQAKSFIEDTSPNKRKDLINELLSSDAFTDYSTTLWCDRLRVKSEFPINLWPNAVQAYHRWIHTSIKANKPYDQFVHEILTSNGSNFRVPQVNFFRAIQNSEPQTMANAVALTFMGSRSESWTEEEQKNLTAFFSNVKFKKTGEWKEEIVYADLFSQPLPDNQSQFTLPDGTTVKIPVGTDSRLIFANWLTKTSNQWFAKNAVNRIWYQLLGSGIINPPDDIRPTNPPVNAELLALLEKELIKSGYDLHHIYRLILNSATYQRSSIPATTTAKAELLFAHYPIRRIDAETLIDSLCRITGTTEQYWSVVPEPFSFIPVDKGSVTLADGSITSPFLEKFGRPPRDTGLATERNNDITSAQMLHLLNSSHIRKKLEQVPVNNFKKRRRGADPLSNLSGLYYSVLSRPPTAEEIKIIRNYAENAEAEGINLATDIVWALINSPEFIFKH